VICNWHVHRVDELPRAKVYLFDVSPRALARLCQTRLPSRYVATLQRYRHGPGVCKVDWALSDPIPWTNPQCRRTTTLHLGGSFHQIAKSEREVARGHHAPHPYMIVCQPSLVDGTRAPAGRHTAWAYCHVPNGSTMDLRDRIEAQIEQHAPGFRDCILEGHSMTAFAMERYNSNYVGGDIAGGEPTLWRQFARPVARLNPYTTPVRNIFLCSASTPPGGGVHGMCGYYAARAAARVI
jgi:phytoene dehydrogenase-like protein